MKKEIRRIIMFCAIVTIGLLLLVFDVTFIQLLALILAIAIIMPFLLGLVTVAEVKTAYGTFKDQRLKKIGFLKKLDDIKLFEKKGKGRIETPAPKVPAAPAAVAPAGKGAETGKAGGQKFPFSTQINSLVATFKSFGTSIRERTKRERKVEDINRMLDSAVSETVEKPKAASPAPAAGAGSASFPSAGGAGSAGADETDPFLSLSGDDFDTGLLDGLDEDGMEAPDAAAPAMGAEAGLDAAPMPDMTLPEPDLPVPSAEPGAADGSSPELDAAAAEILKSQGGGDGLVAFGGLDSAGDGEMDSDFGDLANISLDDVDMDAEPGDESGVAAGMEGTAAPAAAAPAAPAGASPAETPGAVKTAWIPSDAPKGADQPEDAIGTQADMASFAGGASGTDEDLLSSIASDVKKTVKEKDLSLLRELKDFKAPANQIEKELTDMYQRMSTVQKPKNAPEKPTNEIK